MTNNVKSNETVVETKQNLAGPKVADRRGLDNTLKAIVGTCQFFGKVLIGGTVILFGISEICSTWRDNIERKRIKQSNKQ